MEYFKTEEECMINLSLLNINYLKKVINSKSSKDETMADIIIELLSIN